jgi:acetoacetate decarboxylase
LPSDSTLPEPSTASPEHLNASHRDAYPVPDPTTAYAVPLDNPLYGAPPARFRDGEVLTIQYRTDPAAIAALVPAPLEPTSDVVMVQLARWGDVPGLGRNTYEANVMVGVSFTSGDRVVTGSYSPYFYVDSDRAMAGGREFHGQPKRIAEVSLTTNGDLIVGSISRNGITAFTGTLPYKTRQATVQEIRRDVDFVTNINLKIIPHIDGRTAVRQLTSRDLTDIDVTGCWGGPGTAEIRPHAQVPLYRLPVLEHLEGFYWLVEFSLVGGIVLHDFLGVEDMSVEA